MFLVVHNGSSRVSSVLCSNAPADEMSSYTEALFHGSFYMRCLCVFIRLCLLYG
jgi:hypothetical protein